MLWTLFKILAFFALVAVLALGARWLLAASGSVVVTLAGTEYVLSPLIALLALVALMVGAWIALKLLKLLWAVFRFLAGDETAISRHFARSRERRGYDALSDAMIALAAGEPREAMAKADKAEKLLNRPEVTTLMVAQAHEAAGDVPKAREKWKQLVENDRTRFVGIRGLLREELDAGRTDTAMKLAEKAFALKPGHVETQDTLIRMQAREGDWAGARRVLTAKLKSGVLPKDVYKRREAVLTLADARERLAAGETDKARAEALEANRLSPELVPAAVLAARMLIETGEGRRASKVLRTAWAKTHHPDLAAAYADIEPGETPQARIKRFGALLKLDPSAPESRMLDTELHLAAEDFPGARRALGSTHETHPSARALSLMAAIEKGEGAPENVVRAWLTKALSASRGPQWVCDNCGTVHGHWVPVCTNCEAFDSLGWTEARVTQDAVPALAPEMMPLLTAAEEPSAPVVAEAKAEALPGPSVAPAPRPAVPLPATHRAPEPPRPMDPKVVGTTADVDAKEGFETLPAGDSPPAPQDETPTTAGTSRS
ncbi:heme biosynthesis protein HemY [Jannaschia sp. Os4]|uniref:heme biosynthesis protein HemY n=1 Tax=Jannaschia sp. Os4 TaxID=2807617 RepID=UPI0019395830|nr:heme biosynthesis HemY N-terminal domain-containing protein [Jannaschia sp. Os4]MBM2574911.1 heme biosynthesis protein HemY [Jannaschia sp. Os4]